MNKSINNLTKEKDLSKIILTKNKWMIDKKSHANRKKKKKFKKKFSGKEQLTHLFQNFKPNSLIKKLTRKKKLRKNSIKELNRVIIENKNQLSFSPNETVTINKRINYELCDLVLHFFIAVCSALGYLASNGYLKLSLVLFIITIYLYKNYIENTNEQLLCESLNLINQRPERQANFLQRMSTSQLIKLQTSDQIDEHAKWLNDLLKKFWPYINCLIQNEIDKKGFTKHGANIGNGHIIYFERFTLGDKPPVITAISVNKSGLRNDELVIDMKLLYSGNCLLSFSKKTLIFFRMKAGVKDIYFRCSARLTLRPLMDKPPYFGGYSFCLLDKPIIDYEGFNFANLVDNQLFKTYLVNQIGHLVVSPNRLYYTPFNDEEVIRQLKHPSPIGLCFFQIIEAENLPALDIHHFFLTSFSDPFCLIRIGSTSFQTPVVYGSSNPYWYTSNSASIHDLFDVVRVDIYDKDALSSDDFIGSIEFCIRDVALDVCFNGVDKWCPISRSRTGNIHFRITYFKLTKQITNIILKKNNNLIQKSLIKFPFGIFELYIYSLKLYNKLDEKSEPIIQVKFNGITYQTEKLILTDNCNVFKVEQGYQFNILNPKKDIIEFTLLSSFNLVKLVDNLKTKLIGHYALSLCSILNRQIIQTEKIQSLNKEKNLHSKNKQINGLIEKFELYSHSNESKKRNIVGKMKVYVCLSLCKIDETVYNNLQQKIHIKTNPDQITSETALFKRFLMHPTISLTQSFFYFQSCHYTNFNLHDNKISVIDNISFLPSDLDQNCCYAKVRFSWPKAKYIYIEILRIINLPASWIDKKKLYSVSVRLTTDLNCFHNSNFKQIQLKNNLNQKKVLNKKLNSIKSTKKIFYNFKLESVIFNQRLVFNIDHQMNLQNYLMQFVFHATKYNYYFCVTSKQSIQTKTMNLPAIIFRSDPIEQWISLNEITDLNSKNALALK